MAKWKDGDKWWSVSRLESRLFLIFNNVSRALSHALLLVRSVHLDRATGLMAPKAKAPPKPQTFKAPDGTEFATKTEFRDYMMSTYYSWKHKVDSGVLVKSPGDVDGQVFEMSSCRNTTMVVMDKSEAVQIDNLTNCRVFIGCCVSSIFIRNCDSCIFYTCCRQLRLREVTKSTLYVYSQAEVHIEQSTEVAFAPFNGGYSEQSRHFEQAGMDPSKNLWWDIFDHNDPAKTRVNWRLLPQSEMEAAWYPQGTACTPCVQVTPPGTSQALDAGKDGNQVGQAFGMEQMMADAERIKAEAVTDASNKLRMESALLICSAMGKGIDVSVWLTEGGGVGGKIVASDFNTKLTSLSLVVGVEEDIDTKGELELAVCKSALKTIAEACGKGKDRATGEVLIDVGMFLAASEAKVANFVSSQPDAGMPLPAAATTAVPSQSQPLHSSTPPVPPQRVESSPPRSFPGMDKELLDTDTFVASASPSSQPPQSSKRPPTTPIMTHLAEATETIIPDSPYDEEVAFDLEEEEETDTVLPYGARKSTAPPSFAANKRGQAGVGGRVKSRQPQQEQEQKQHKPQQEAVRAVRSSPQTKSSSPLQAPRPSSAGPTRSPSKASTMPGASSSRGIANGTSSGVARMMSSSMAHVHVQRSSSAGASRASNTSSVLRSSLSATATRPLNMQEDAERKARKAIRFTDLYHLVQIHLGFIDGPYRMIPARGPIVTSTPRKWLSVREIQDAFGAAREHFSEAAVSALFANVAVFAKTKGSEDEVLSGSSGSGEGSAALVKSVWLKQYLVHLRLTKQNLGDAAAVAMNNTAGGTAEGALAGGVGSPAITGPAAHSRDGPLEWKDWLGTKLIDDQQARLFKPKEFRRALAGRKHALTREELFRMLDDHDILPADKLNKEVSQQVRAWILDMDGRMDFIHSLNVEKRRYLKENALVSWKQLSVDQRLEVERNLRKKLASGKSAVLLASEQSSAAVTKVLFPKFERSNKQQGYDPKLVIPWGTWLDRHHAATEDSIRRFKLQAAEREKTTQQKRTRSRAVAPLADVEAQLLKAAEALLPNHNMELRKSLVALRRTVMAGSSNSRSKGASSTNGPLVSKDMFQKHLDHVLAPRLQELPEGLRCLAVEARHSHEGLPVARTQEIEAAAAAAAAAATAGAGAAGTGDVADTLFRADQGEALERVKSIDAEREAKKKADFDEWTSRKEAAKAAAEEQKVRAVVLVLAPSSSDVIPMHPGTHSLPSSHLTNTAAARAGRRGCQAEEGTASAKGLPHMGPSAQRRQVRHGRARRRRALEKSGPACARAP